MRAGEVVQHTLPLSHPQHRKELDFHFLQNFQLAGCFAGGRAEFFAPWLH